MVDNKPYNGFTLLELIIVIAITGIVSAIAIPTLITTLYKLRVDKAAAQVAWDLKRAQSAAIKNRAKCKVSFSEGGTYTAVVETNPAKTIIEVDIPDRYPGIEFKCKGDNGSEETDPVDDITFKPTRKASLTGSIFIMPSSDFASNRTDRMRRIVVSNTGRIKIKIYISGDCNDGNWE